MAQRIQQLHQTLPPSVRLIAVSKTYSADHIRAAYAAGQRDFGENRVQEASAKQAQLSDLQDITWHLIGQLQSNKARKAIELFDWIHSVDSLKLAERLDRLAGDLHRQPKICFQVKHRPDPSKTGLLPPELTSEVTRICELKHIRVEGLMTIPPLATNDLEKLHIFEENRNLAEALATEAKRLGCINMSMKQLSMGMSGDYSLALQAGSTAVRLGQTIFGTRG
ncbi:MAG: YggS family pyridoxal phosphate-dependent enzyme [Synechococcales cyanobacterium RM1_1_8]|nr:YggS family pyridoxal phosphate-dependent enzyme [Synechococcales cyanobacterium RM1_1_8]